ncbi:MAG: hypothetical protein U0O22_09790 [Acutalibacteraceae bacterium]
MAENIRDILFILLMVYGLINIWKCFYTFILKSEQDKEVYIIIPLNDTCENVEQIIRSTAQRVMIMGKNRFDKVLCVDYGCNNENCEIVKRLCREYGFINYITADTFYKIVKET